MGGGGGRVAATTDGDLGVSFSVAGCRNGSAIGQPEKKRGEAGKPALLMNGGGGRFVVERGEWLR